MSMANDLCDIHVLSQSKKRKKDIHVLSGVLEN